MCVCISPRASQGSLIHLGVLMWGRSRQGPQSAGPAQHLRKRYQWDSTKLITVCRRVLEAISETLFALKGELMYFVRFPSNSTLDN